MIAESKDNIMQVGSLKARMISVTFYDSNVKEYYKKIKTKSTYKETDIVFVNPMLIFGKEHLIGIMRIINEERKRKMISEIKNPEVEFLMRLCCTDQIKEALNRNFGDKEKKDYVVFIMSDNNQVLHDIEIELACYGFVHVDSSDSHLSTCIASTKNKRDYIINSFFKDKLKNRDSTTLEKNVEFLKFLIERAAIALK